MNRRAYLAATTAMTLAGCMGSGGGPASSDTEDDTDGEEDEPEGPLSGPDDGETFDDFEDLDVWETVSGTFYRVDEAVYTGSQAALLEADETEEHARIVRELSPPVDFSGMCPGIAMATNAPGAPLIQLIDEDGDRVDFRQQSGGNTSLVRTNFGIAHVEGEPDMSAVAQIQIGFSVEEAERGQLLIDDLHFVSRPEPGIVLVQFDGGYESVYTEGHPVLSEYEYPATVFVSTERIRGASYHEGSRLTEAQLEDLHASGWTVGSHASHGLDLTDLNNRDPAEEIRNARQLLESHGYDEGARYFSYPRNRYDDTILELVDEHHDLAFAGRYPAQGVPANPLLCSRVTNPDAEQAREILDLTAEMGGVTALCYLDVSAEVREALEETMAHVHELETAGELEVGLPADLEEMGV